MGKSSKRMTKIVEEKINQKQDLTLPAEVVVALHLFPKDQLHLRDAYIYVLRMKGWTLESVGQALDLTRERIRQLESRSKPIDAITILSNPGTFPIPEVPKRSIYKEVSFFAEPSEKDLTRLKQLQPLAALVRSNSPNYRKEAEEFSSLLNQVINVEGVPASHVAKLIGITHGAIQFRLVRYGYASTSGKSKAYQTIHSANRAIGGRNQNERVI
jgi:hypothetical protein